ncbi:MAG: hypothetical protein K9N21_20300 [Deltaproteobacteria bacterium]|nr:hypothetical protein [Deltaproteobacteria bacterium]
MDDSAFETDMSGKKKSLRVYLINPPTGDNPWRTLGDYQQEQKEARDRHAMFQEQHRILQKSFRANIIAVTAAVVAALAACVLTYFSYQSMPYRQEKIQTPHIEQMQGLEPTKKVRN